MLCNIFVTFCQKIFGGFKFLYYLCIKNLNNLFTLRFLPVETHKMGSTVVVRPFFICLAYHLLFL